MLRPKTHLNISQGVGLTLIVNTPPRASGVYRSGRHLYTVGLAELSHFGHAVVLSQGIGDIRRTTDLPHSQTLPPHLLLKPQKLHF